MGGVCESHEGMWEMCESHEGAWEVCVSHMREHGRCV